MVQVQPAADSDLELIVGWLAKPDIAKWLDFGPTRPLTAPALKYATAQGSKRLYLFSIAGQGTPIGVVALGDIHPRFKTAMLWYALGEPHYAGRGLTSMAAAKVVSIGFRELELGAIHAWVVAGNEASQRILEKIGFRKIGRQRHCHYIRNQPYDRILFDIMAGECKSPEEW